jgi:hypothetical protein
LNILEEVNGLAVNARSYAMAADDERHYSLTLPIVLGSVVKYRYTREGEAAMVEEHVSDGRQVRYRLYHVTGPGTIADVVSRWTDTQFSGPTGRISGSVIDAVDGRPLPNLLVAAGGAQALTAADGTFLLEGLPDGVHNLVVFALDGLYRTFQQGARVAAGSTTPAVVTMSPASMVSVVFVVSTPADTIPAVPIRLAGSLYQTGNTFANLSGGMSTIAARMPGLTLLPDGRYSIALSLPAGADLRYLYTLGDGFWNTEKTAANPFPVRQFIVPDSGGQVNDIIESWTTSSAAPITFDLTVPEDTPPDETVSIQFNPLFGWTEPVPMWRLSATRWAYVLASPPGGIGELRYRFCRNDQCGSADDARTMGSNHPGFSVVPGSSPQVVKDTVESWAWLQPEITPMEVVGQPVAVRGSEFIAGVELQPRYHPSWVAHTSNLLNQVQELGANWIVISPTWSYTRNNPPVLELVPGGDPLWQDLSAMINDAHGRGLRVALFPTPRFSLPSTEWWTSGSRDFSWWLVWFDRYRNFALHHADLAERGGAQALVLGGDWLAPALPGGVLADGASSGVPADAESRWRALLEEVRAHYRGPILWALTYAQAVNEPPAFLDAVDQIYVLFSEKLAERADATPEELQAAAGDLLDNGLLPLQTALAKPVLLAAAYPSADGAAMACLPDQQGSCLAVDLLAQPNPDRPEISIDLVEQADIYQALLTSINGRTWISGFVSRGFYPPAMLRDKSTSVHGKPAQDVVTYWFPRLLGSE